MLVPTGGTDIHREVWRRGRGEGLMALCPPDHSASEMSTRAREVGVATLTTTAIETEGGGGPVTITEAGTMRPLATDTTPVTVATTLITGTPPHFRTAPPLLGGLESLGVR